ncbi:MAG: hypothetical protein M0R06_02995 [Sphaerochaeta sp.]|nr:hypothetical protein [Sphaerochaeta sp.]
MLYKVRVKMPGKSPWITYENIWGDSTYQPPGGAYMERRVLIDRDGRRIEIPFSAIIEFSPERETAIKSDMEKTAGRPINIPGPDDRH